ncbi:MAG: DedA family protein [Humidesulfovibrio sp.]|nr:DedA family protein [Humidesulfovibrio sp.]
MLTETISRYAIQILETTGLAGAAFLMALESMIAPVPSEAVMPFVGFLVADGKWGLFEAILATSIGSFLGSYISYLMGYYGGRPFVLKVGKYLLLDVHDLEMTERFFQRKGSSLTLFASRFIPVVRHLVSIPAGIGKMRFWPFAIATTAGATMWNTFLLLCGFKLRENWEMVQTYRHQFDALIIGMLVVAVAWYVWYKLKRKRTLRAEAAD